ncbi:hypothetical protein CEXT_507081 [Caerostris extrusa]|uniref:Uncharacterized protein n=1 Tax=Caerostris extrusa TaxID=172846 RepID=A0AAV4URU6_CAEEX|nr:hypothetical protein CEXT_507081 [Caerostris extrusa]
MDVTAVHMIPIKKPPTKRKGCFVFRTFSFRFDFFLQSGAKRNYSCKGIPCVWLCGFASVCQIQCHWNGTGSACCIEIYGCDLALHDTLLF